MSSKYNDYLKEHIQGVYNAYDWMSTHLDRGKYFDFVNSEGHQILRHDDSKGDPEEYGAYDAYFYGGNRSYQVVQDFNRAWLRHIHKNPHHWQHWVLIQDDPKPTGDDYICIEMPKEYVMEMIADWWSFSWKAGNLYEIFDWYEKHKDIMRLHKNTRKLVEDALHDIREVLDREKEDKEVTGND